MSTLLLEGLKRIISERRAEGAAEEIIINALKEELHYAVLGFLYNKKTYSHLTMYGGTLLRIAYGLPRMSIDLDFQTDQKIDLKKLGEDLAEHFKGNHGTMITVKEKAERLTGNDYLFIKFPNLIGDLGDKRKNGLMSILKIRVDINIFPHIRDFAMETLPVTWGNSVFSIRIYPLPTLMASKIAAVLLRTKRGIGEGIANCKPRDIYDLMWYMERKTVPDVEYLKAIFEKSGKPFEARNVIEVFDILQRRVANLDDALFKHDLAPLFYDPIQYDAWHAGGGWRERFVQLRNAYALHRVKTLKAIFSAKDFSSGNRHLRYIFSTEEPGVDVLFTCILTEYWYTFSDMKIGNEHRRRDLVYTIPGATDLDHSYIGLFYTKIEDYLKRNDHVVLQTKLETKIIRASAENLHVKTQVFLDRRLLVKERFEDLL